jgi:ubiquinone/menaquinone biosynthesis C-methylase UbiE
VSGRAAPAQDGHARRAGQGRLVRDRFHSHAGAWEEVYRRADLFSVIHQDRHARALRWIDDLRLPAGTPVLEIGAGAGLLTVELARRGFEVAAADVAPGMLEIVRRRARESGVQSRVQLLLADATQLPCRSGAFQLVAALGVLPWLDSASAAVAELSRVLRRGGHLVANTDNSHRLNRLLDPRHHPALDPVRAAAKFALRAAGFRLSADRRPAVTAHRLSEFDQMLAAAGLMLVRHCTFGFGPFTILGMPMIGDRLGVAVNARLQRLADAGLAGLRSSGGQYLVLARASGRR